MALVSYAVVWNDCQCLTNRAALIFFKLIQVDSTLNSKVNISTPGAA